jgi:peptidoglycan/LPS O-acetylase OafA/YrhL
MRLSFINGLRGYAILAVIWHHVFGPLYRAGHHGSEWAGLTLSPYSPLSNGWLGVNLFFVLSGFVLALPYFDGRRTFSAPGRIRWFYVQRAKRLLPLYYFCVLFSMIFIKRITAVEEPLRDLFLMATVTFNFLPETYLPRYNWVLWSLGLEVWFSIVFPFLIIAISRFGIWRVGFVVLVAAMGTRFAGYGYEFVPGLVPSRPI